MADQDNNNFLRRSYEFFTRMMSTPSTAFDYFFKKKEVKGNNKGGYDDLKQQYNTLFTKDYPFFSTEKVSELRKTCNIKLTSKGKMGIEMDKHERPVYFSEQSIEITKLTQSSPDGQFIKQPILIVLCVAIPLLVIVWLISCWKEEITYGFRYILFKSGRMDEEEEDEDTAATFCRTRDNYEKHKKLLRKGMDSPYITKTDNYQNPSPQSKQSGRRKNRKGKKKDEKVTSSEDENVIDQPETSEDKKKRKKINSSENKNAIDQPETSEDKKKKKKINSSENKIAMYQPKKTSEEDTFSMDLADEPGIELGQGNASRCEQSDGVESNSSSILNHYNMNIDDQVISHQLNTPVGENTKQHKDVDSKVEKNYKEAASCNKDDIPPATSSKLDEAEKQYRQEHHSEMNEWSDYNSSEYIGGQQQPISATNSQCTTLHVFKTETYPPEHSINNVDEEQPKREKEEKNTREQLPTEENQMHTIDAENSQINLVCRSDGRSPPAKA